MPAVWITLDSIDGETRIKGPLHPDEIDLTGYGSSVQPAKISEVA